MTDKEKYNNLSSIDIHSLSPEELKIAIHEWAEGDEAMEALLWKCYYTGVETKQSHAGGRPFIEVSADQNADKVKNMIDSVSDIDGFSILISPDGGNPFSGDVFYKAGIGIIFLSTEYQEDAEILFNKMNASLDLEKKSNSKMADSIINLYNFFREKESDLEFRIRFVDGKYIFNAEINGRMHTEEFEKMFSGFGLVQDKEAVFNSWCFESDNLEEFGNRLEAVSNAIISSYSFEKPDKLDERMSLNEVFRYLRRRYVERDGDDTIYKEVASQFYEEFNQHQKDLYEGKITRDEGEEWIKGRFFEMEADVMGSQRLN